MITIPARVSHAEIENFRSTLDKKTNETLRVPTHLELGGVFGIPVAIVQLIADWANKNIDPVLRLYSNLDENDQMSDFAGTPHGMTALYFAKILEGKSGEQAPAKNGLIHIIPYVKAMQNATYESTMRGRGTFLCCFANARNEFLFPLYKSPEKGILRTRDEFPALMSQILRKVAPETHRLDEEDISNVSKLVYELFSNTHRHARRDVYDKPITRGVRGIYVKFISQGYSESTNSNFSSKDTNLSQFIIQSITESQNKKKTDPKEYKIARSFLEISVFDTGPGLARRWLYKEAPLDPIKSPTLSAISIQDEYKLVKDCFVSGYTSDNEYGKGEGLPNVIESLANLKAFLRLRTGRLCLEQNFFRSGNKFALDHWQPETPELNDTIGARFTAIIPLGVTRT